MKNKKIKVFYKPQMAFLGKKNSYSNSPKKPKIFVERLMNRKDFNERFEIESSWKPYDRQDFLLAHYAKYVFGFFSGDKDVCESNGINWSSDFAETVRYTNASLYESIKYSYLNPDTICCSPTSGFHHAKPDSGSGFCTFSGQVIASIKMYCSYEAVGFYFDLDGHFGNSIEDTRKDSEFSNIVNKCIPKWANVNPKGVGDEYMKSFRKSIELFIKKAVERKINYVVWCHGADSHKDDNLGHQLNTKQWLECTKIFIEAIKQIEEKTGENFPVSYALFGGYRKNYNEVIDLHEKDTEIILTICN